MKMHLRVIAAGAAAAFLTACGGYTADTLPASKHTAAAKARFIIRVPAAGAVVNGRHKHYISPATQAVAINLQNFNVAPSSPNCTTQSSTLTCTFAVDAPKLGYASFTVTTYDKPLSASGDVQGNQLSSGSTSVNIVAGTQNIVKVTTSGVPASATFSVANLTPPMGTATVIPITFNVKDADGYTIVGPYTAPLEFSAPNPSNGLALTFLQNGTAAYAAGAWSSSDVIGIDYGGHFVGTTTINATLNNQAVSSVVFDPQPTFSAETAVNTPLNNAQAYRDMGAPITTYFTEPAKHGFGTMQGSTAITEFATPSGGTPLHLTHSFSPEGVVFAEDNGHMGSLGIGMTSGGAVAISDSSVPTASSNPGLYQIAQLSLSGTEAITEYNAGKIAEYVNEGDPLAGGKGYVLVEYATGAPNSTPAGIVAVSNGFEFADPGANAIGFLSVTTNAFTYHPVPSAGAHPTDIVTDQNGKLWFTEPGVNKIGKIDPATNTVTEYPCGGSPIAIVAQYTTLGVLTSSGKIDIYNVTDGSYKEYTPPPSSSSGQVAGIGDGGNGDIIVLRSNGSTGSISDFYYE